MSITALAFDHCSNNTYSVVGKENVDGTSKSFGSYLSDAGKQKCPYGILAKDGVISYNGVNFMCDYNQNAITLGNMYEKEKVLKISLPSGGSLHVNVDNIDELAKAADMFTPEDLNAIMRAIHEYNHCTRKRYEIEEEKSKPIEETAEESETPDAEKEPEIEKNSLIEQINSYKTERYNKLFNDDLLKM